jgi:Mn-dependent DtxR family transcriptional regulator
MPYREAIRIYRRMKIYRVLVSYGLDDSALADEAEQHERTMIDAVLWALHSARRAGGA